MPGEPQIVDQLDLFSGRERARLSATAVTTLLAVGDVHLGRRPSRLPDDLEEYGRSAADLTPAAAWRSATDLAIERRVDAVVMAGDVVESENARFEAFGHLRRGVEALVAAGIPVFAVAGNHDVEALPRLQKLIPHGFRLIGAGGRWESVELIRRDRRRLRLLGWSFPAPRVTTSPLESLPPAIEDDLPTIGVLHCDVDGQRSPYAPVWADELERSHPHAWLLGHVHRPGLGRKSARPIGYLGSIIGLHPGETGAHGPWLVRVAADGAMSVEQVPLAPLRWEEAAVAVDAVGDLDGLDASIHVSIEELHDRLVPELAQVRAVGVRVRLVGLSPIHRRLRQALASEERERLRVVHGGVVYFVHELRDDSSPAFDLDRLARGSDPPALLARHLLELDRGGDAAAALVRDAERALAGVLSSNNWGQLGELDDPPRVIREALHRAALLALDELRAQTGESEGPGFDAEVRR